MLRENVQKTAKRLGYGDENQENIEIQIILEEDSLQKVYSTFLAQLPPQTLYNQVDFRA